MAGAIRFGRAGAASSLARTTSLPPITGFTIMAWFRPIDFTNFNTLFAYGASSGSGQYVFLGTDTSGHFYIAGYGQSGVAGSTLVAGVWRHAALTVSGSSGTTTLGYLDGALNVSDTTGTATSQKLLLGNDNDGDWANLNLAAVKIWNRVLTADQITAEIPSILPVDWGGLNSCYPITSGWEELDCGLVVPTGALTRWADWSGNGLEFTESGAIDMDVGCPAG